MDLDHDLVLTVGFGIRGVEFSGSTTRELRFILEELKV